MKVAIVGAGLSGLSCAFELKKHGIKPTIFEKESHIGNNLDYSITILRMFTDFNESPTKYFKKNYGLDIASLNVLKKSIMIGPSRRILVRGNLGYIFKRGQEPYSIENQIARQVNLPVIFDTYIHFDDIKNDFDYIVWASGSNKLSRRLNTWTSAFNTNIRIATMLGDFKINSATMWLNTEYAKNGYAYLLPYSKKNATLTLIVNNISPYELDYYWKKFLSKENIQSKILETRDVEYSTGFVNPIKLNNIYLVGNSAGLTESCLGFGAVNAIRSGITAGRCIAKNLDYTKLMKDTGNFIKSTYELRKFLNSFENRDFDRLINFLRLPLVKQMVYNNPFYKSIHSARIIKHYNNFINN
ncbi:NAD(P)-binding protein [Wukongibacter sp. M2B1]|uniref:NAD(P)-binding protein n=1 Tax=Wukongibacter sp. M2B1 TaxID=3088895 RepID=UPI003D7BAA01